MSLLFSNNVIKNETSLKVVHIVFKYTTGMQIMFKQISYSKWCAYHHDNLQNCGLVISVRWRVTAKRRGEWTVAVTDWLTCYPMWCSIVTISSEAIPRHRRSPRQQHQRRAAAGEPAPTHASNTICRLETQACNDRTVAVIQQNITRISQ